MHTHQSLAHVEPSLDLWTRNHELTEIANNIASLAELFKDLSVLVIDQGTLLDSIEYKIEQTTVHLQEAVKELEVATQFVDSVTIGPVMLTRLKVSKEYGKEEMQLPSLAHHMAAIVGGIVAAIAAIGILSTFISHDADSTPPSAIPTP